MRRAVPAGWHGAFQMGHSTDALLLHRMGTDLRLEELWDEALPRFESYAEDHCDENNDWTVRA